MVIWDFQIFKNFKFGIHVYMYCRVKNSEHFKRKRMAFLIVFKYEIFSNREI